jgi:hypothetical protein
LIKLEGKPTVEAKTAVDDDDKDKDFSDSTENLHGLAGGMSSSTRDLKGGGTDGEEDGEHLSGSDVAASPDRRRRGAAAGDETGDEDAGHGVTTDDEPE